jgi:hypothetical protein
MATTGSLAGGSSGSTLAGSISPELMELFASKVELGRLRVEFEAVTFAVRSRVRRELHRTRVRAKTMQSFTVKSLATIIGWFTAQTFFNFLLIPCQDIADNPAAGKVIARSVYAVFVSAAVPVALWLLAGHRHKSGTPISAKITQAELTRASLPAIVAWAWNDLAWQPKSH